MFFSISNLKKYAGLAVAGLLIMGVAGCGDNPTPEKLTPEQVIGKAVPALQAVSSFHFNLDTSKLQKPMPGVFITKADGDVAKPDKLAGDVSATAMGLPINIKVIVDGQNQYMTDPASGKWTTMSSALNVAQYFDPNGVSDILSNVKGLQSDGSEAISGTDTYRLKGAVPASALKKLSPEVTATGDLTTTLWIGSGDYLLRRVQLTGPFFEGEPTDIVRTINMSDYNKAVKIETPVVK